MCLAAVSSCTPYKGLYTFKVCIMYPLGTWQSDPVVLCIMIRQPASAFKQIDSEPSSAQRNCMLFKV